MTRLCQWFVGEVEKGLLTSEIQQGNMAIS